MIGALWLITGALAAPPTLEEVLDSVDRYFPLVVAARAEIDAAEADVMGTQGWLDPIVDADAANKSGEYDWTTVDAGVFQRTPAWGLSVAAGWRGGFGDFPSYYGDLKTVDAGEFFAELRLPLLKGGWTDDDRTAVRVAMAKLDEAQAKLVAKRVAYGQDAREAYGKWLAAGEKQRLAQRMADVATQNLAAVEFRIQKGDAAPIDRVDAQRVLAERQLKLAETTRDLQQAALKLGLYLRGDDGLPAPPTEAPPPLPTQPPWPADALTASLTDALAIRPELAQLSARIEAVDAKVQLARIGLLPKLDFKAGVDQPLSTPEKGPYTDVKVGGTFSVALLQRQARGKLDRASAERAVVQAEQRYAIDRVEQEVRSAWAALTAADERLALAARQVELAQQLEEATRTGYQLGDRTLFDLYLREQSALKAALDAIDVWVERWNAEAELLAATGRF